MNIDEALGRVRAAPPGPRVAAFFDFDGTLLHGFSGVHFFRDRLLAGKVGATEIAETMINGLRGTDTEADFERFVAVAFRAWRGHTEDELLAIGQRLFDSTLAGHLYPDMWRLVKAHQHAGHTVVIASSASRYQLQAAADALGVHHILCTPLEIVDGVVTGRVDGVSLWRSGKAVATRAFVDEHDIDADASFTYSNGGEDVEFLTCSGHPTAVNPDRVLDAAARQRGWPILRVPDRGTPGVGDVVRTVAAYSGLAASVWSGIGLGLLNRSRRTAVDSMTDLGGEVPLTAAGIDVHVVGEANAWVRRPAVFLFNHQSQLDPVILARVLRNKFTGVTKRKVARNPIWGPIMMLGDAAVVDPGDPAVVRAALDPVVEKLRGGLSVVVAPEGTRSVTPEIGRFRKGAFHIAMQAGVPIVPVVIRNAGEIMWKNSLLLRGGTIDVAVLDPIPVDDWTVDTLDEHIAEVEDLYRATLMDWPTG